MAQRVQFSLPKHAYRVKFEKPVVRFEWGGAFEGWARNWVYKNFWRVRELFGDHDDALQECALIFVRCCRTYEGKVDNPAWMMSLYKRAVINDWHTFAERDGRIRSVPAPDPTDDIDHNAGILATAIGEASTELRQVLGVLAIAPAEFLSILFAKTELLQADDPDIVASAARSINRRIRRLCGISGHADILSELRQLLE